MSLGAESMMPLGGANTWFYVNSTYIKGYEEVMKICSLNLGRYI